MKKNKKLFLASIAAMGAVAIGTGAVSTFAWYSASTTAALNAADPLGTINTNVNGSITGLNVTIGYSAVTTGTAPDLTDGSGNCKYWSGSARTATGAQATGLFTFQANLSPTSAADKELLRGHTYLVYVKGEGNVKVLSSASATAVATYTVSAVEHEGLAVYVKVAQADLAVTVSLDNSSYSSSVNINYAVRTNNEAGLEYMKAGEALASSGQVIKATNAGDIGDDTIGYSPTTFHVQEKSGSWGDKANTGYIHSEADKISVSAGEQQ